MGPILLSVIYVIVFTVLVTLYLHLSNFYDVWKTLAFIPGPKGLPFIGLSLRIRKIPPKDRFQWLNDICFESENGIVATWFGTQGFVNIRKPQQIEIIFLSSTYISKKKIYNHVTPLLGNSILTSTENVWFYLKKALLPAFETSMLDKYITTMHEKVDVLAECIRKDVATNPQKSINIFNLVNKYALDTLCEIAMGVKMDLQRNCNQEYADAFQKFYEISSKRYYKFWSKWDIIFYRTKDGRKFSKVIKFINDVTEKTIAQKELTRSQKDTEHNVENAQVGNDEHISLLEFLLQANQTSKYPLSNKEIRQEIHTFIYAGHQITSAAISWGLFLLGNAPKVQDKLRKEVELFFQNVDQPFTAKQLGQLKYLDMVVKETLRYYPSVPTISRFLENNVVIDNFYIPPGVILNIQIYQLHHDPEIWSEPETFNPDRFLPENSNGRSPYAYCPFSDGPRSCIGENFALLQIKLALIIILQNWRVSSVLKPNAIKLTFDHVLKPCDDVIELYFTRIKSVHS